MSKCHGKNGVLFSLLTCVIGFAPSVSQSSQTLRRKVESLRDNAAVGAYFAIPSLVYLVYNGLSFINLRLLEPGTYRVLINSRIIFSGLLLQWFFQIQLSRRQWMGIALLVSACIVEQSGSFQVDAGMVLSILPCASYQNPNSFMFCTVGIMAILLMCLQGLCSSLGGVYFQWLLQKPSAGEIGLWEKNIYLYGYSIVFNFIIVLVLNPAALHPVAFVSNISWPVITIVTTAAFGGISTSLLLRHLDVLVKEYANFAEMVVVAVAQNRIFGTPIRGSLLIAICMVSYSLYL